MKKNQAVALVWYCKTGKGWTRYPVVLGPNGRIKLGYVMMDGVLTHVPNGRFEIRSYVDRKAVYKRAGDNAADALAALDRERHLHSARSSAEAAGVKIEEITERLPVRKAALSFIRDAEARSALEAAKVNRLVTDEFIASIQKVYVDEITRDDVLRFHAAMRKRGLSDRTVANRDARLRSFLHFCKVDVPNVTPPKPKYEAKLPAIYSTEDLRTLLAAADEYMKLVIEIGFKCGLREQELMYLEWNDIDFASGALRIVGKPHLGFKVKDSEQREVPIPQDLVRALTLWRGKYPTARLVLPTDTGRPNTKLLRGLKRLAKRAGLNCGSCKGCLSKLGECRQWQLHSLRRTYGTTLLRNNMDLATVQRFLGHSDLASTMRYLRPATAAQAQAAVNAIAWV